jgi:hypothetical protein
MQLPTALKFRRREDKRQNEKQKDTRRKQNPHKCGGNTKYGPH